MSWRFWKPSVPATELPDAPVPVVDPAAMAAVVAKGAVFNPSDQQLVNGYDYRAHAIARDTEQRREEGREKHPDHDQLVAEAMSYGWMLIGAGRWTAEQVAALEKRLTGR